MGVQVYLYGLSPSFQILLSSFFTSPSVSWDLVLFFDSFSAIASGDDSTSEAFSVSVESVAESVPFTVPDTIVPAATSSGGVMVSLWDPLLEDWLWVDTLPLAVLAEAVAALWLLVSVAVVSWVIWSGVMVSSDTEVVALGVEPI